MTLSSTSPKKTSARPLHALEDLALVAPVRDARVPKYEHRIRTVLNLRRDETAILCLLMLRGPQTPGELRSRADRLFTFDDLPAVQSTLERLAARPTADEAGNPSTGPLTTILPRQPGSREARYAHLLGDPALLASARASSEPEAHPGAPDSSTTQRLAHLEAEIAALTAALKDLRARVELLEPNT